MTGNGTSKKKIATNAAAASATIARFLSARLPTRITASMTTAITAGASPKNMPATIGTWPVRRVDDAEHENRDDAGQDEQRAGRDSAGGAVQQPADVRRELLRSGPGSNMQ
jgi:hypothetical protein